jgi:N-acetylated-alpha-linked acidic dipeptidase
LNFYFGGEDGGGIYHSIYDDFYWYTHFSDTDFVYGRALAQTVGLAVLRLADSQVLPFEFSDFADTVRMYLEDLKKFQENQRHDILERNRELAEGVFTATTDPKETFVPPPREEVPPFLNFAPLENAVAEVARQAEKYSKTLEKVRDYGLDPDKVRRVNALLLDSERDLTLPEGLPSRPWFKHQIYAPGFYTGYGVKTLPGAREAIEQSQWQDAEGEIAREAKVLEAEARLISAAADELAKAMH